MKLHQYCRLVKVKWNPSISSLLQQQQQQPMMLMPWPAELRCWQPVSGGGLSVFTKILTETKVVPGSAARSGRRRGSSLLLWRNTTEWFRAQKLCAWKPFCWARLFGRGSYHTMVCTLICWLRSTNLTHNDLKPIKPQMSPLNTRQWFKS